MRERNGGNHGTHAHGGEFLMGALCGAAIGAAVGLLLAPRAGSELRSQLADSAQRFRRRASEAYSEASDAVNDVVDRGRDAADRGRAKFEEVRANFGQAAAGADDY